MLNRYFPILLSATVLMLLFSSCGLGSNGGYYSLPGASRISSALLIGVILAAAGYFIYKKKAGSTGDQRMIGAGLMGVGLCIAFWPLLSWLFFGLSALIGLVIRVGIIAVVVLFVYMAFFRDKK